MMLLQTVCYAALKKGAIIWLARKLDTPSHDTNLPDPPTQLLSAIAALYFQSLERVLERCLSFT